jgi:hypothetical protein
MEAEKMTFTDLFLIIAKILVIVAVTASVLLGAGYVGYTIGESHGAVQGYLETMDYLNGLPTSEVCK